MDKENINYLNLSNLNKSIDELRDILNEICITKEETEDNEERLKISQCLDELIVKYMNEIYK